MVGGSAGFCEACGLIRIVHALLCEVSFEVSSWETRIAFINVDHRFRAKAPADCLCRNVQPVGNFVNVLGAGPLVARNANRILYPGNHWWALCVGIPAIGSEECVSHRVFIPGVQCIARGRECERFLSSSPRPPNSRFNRWPDFQLKLP